VLVLSVGFECCYLGEYTVMDVSLTSLVKIVSSCLLVARRASMISLATSVSCL
jgi:hypothetical protein